MALLHRNYWIEAIITAIFALMVVGFRLGSRAKRIGLNMFDPDDYLMFVASLMMFTIYAIFFWESSYNSGASTWEYAGPSSGWSPTPEDMDMMVKGSQVMLAYTILCVALIWTTKVCMCLLYWRLMSKVDPLRRLVQIGFTVVGITFAAAIITIFTACQPSFSGYWQVPRPANEECSVAYGPVVRVLPAVLNICADLYLIVPPAVMTWRVKATRERKITLVVVFGVSLFLTVVAALRIGLPYAVASGNLAISNTQWAAREGWVALITTNVPVVFGELNKLGLSDWVRKRFGKPAPPTDNQDPEAGTAGADKPVIAEAHHADNPTVPDAPRAPSHSSADPSPAFGAHFTEEPRLPSSLSRRSRFTEDLNDNDRGFPSAKTSASRSTEDFELESLCSNDDRPVIPRESF